MESFKENWMRSFLYLIFILLFLFFLHSQFLVTLTIHFDRINLKRQPPSLPLRFRTDGTFKILQIADMHYGNGITTRCKDVPWSVFHRCSDLNTTQFVRRLIDAEKPDFLAYTGDNIFGSSATDAAESLLKAFAPAIESGLPWAAVLGNHDHESTMNRQELMYFISLMDYSVSQVNPSSEENLGDLQIDGFGNYHLMVRGAFGSPMANSTALDLFFLDSGDRVTVDGKRTYAWITESQLRWLYGICEGLKGGRQHHNYHGHITPSLATPVLGFFHIPIPEIRRLYHQKVVGQLQEAIACSSVDSGVLPALVSMKNVKAVFIGHDHVNDFCGNLDGIWFCYGGGLGYHAYGRKGWSRRARIIQAELSKGDKSWMDVERIRTWKRLDDEMSSKIDEQVLWERGS